MKYISEDINIQIPTCCMEATKQNNVRYELFKDNNT